MTAGLVPNGETKRSPSRGVAEVLDVKPADQVVGSADLRHAEPPIEELLSLVRFEWSALDEWFEEDEPIYPDPGDLGRSILEDLSSLSLLPSTRSR